MGRIRQHPSRQQEHPASNQTLDGEFVVAVPKLEPRSKDREDNADVG